MKMYKAHPNPSANSTGGLQTRLPLSKYHKQPQAKEDGHKMYPKQLWSSNSLK